MTSPRSGHAEAPKAHRRLKYIDWARAVAILVMVEAHTVDSWIRPALRSTQAFRNLLVLGGLAAPLFLWLAGLSVVLSAERTFQRTGSRSSATSAICKRGLEIFVLAFLFRLQAFIVSPGSPVVMLFKVDILNVMGPAIVVAGLVWGAIENRATLTLGYSAAAIGVAMVTPILRLADWVAAMPTWVQWYIRPSGDYTTFTAFPWCGFVFAGAALGAIIARRSDVRSEWRLQVALAAAGGAILQLGIFTASLPTIYRASSFWTSSPTYFVIRVGIMTVALSALYFVELVGVGGVSDTPPTPIERLGRASLFIYWIHMELVYGYSSKALWHRLSVGQWAVAYAAFCIILYGLLILRDRLVERWRQTGHIWPYDLRYAQEMRKNR